MGLRKKISLLVLVITVISIFITAIIGFYFNYQMERENIYLAMESQVVSLNADVNNWLDKKTQTIEVLGDIIEKRDLSKEEISSNGISGGAKVWLDYWCHYT